MKKRHLNLFASVFCLLAINCAGSAKKIEVTTHFNQFNEVLRRIDRFTLHIAQGSPSLHRLGMTKNISTADKIVEKFATHGIEAISVQRSKDWSASNLIIEVIELGGIAPAQYIGGAGLGSDALNLRIVAAIREMVLLKKDPALPVLGTIASIATRITIRPSIEEYENGLLDFMDEFINEYKKARRRK